MGRANWMDANGSKKIDGKDGLVLWLYGDGTVQKIHKIVIFQIIWIERIPDVEDDSQLLAILILLN